MPCIFFSSSPLFLFSFFLLHLCPSLLQLFHVVDYYDHNYLYYFHDYIAPLPPSPPPAWSISTTKTNSANSVETDPSNPLILCHVSTRDVEKESNVLLNWEGKNKTEYSSILIGFPLKIIYSLDLSISFTNSTT